MTAGRLAAAAPAATTNTTLYQCPINRATSAIIDVCNTAGTAATYRTAIRDYNHVSTLDGAGYSFKKGNVVSDYIIRIEPAVQDSEFNPGEILNGTNGDVSFKYQDVFKPTNINEIPIKVAPVAELPVDTGTLTGGFILNEETLTGQTTGLTALVYGSRPSGYVTSIDGVSDAATSVIANTVGTIAPGDLLTANAEIATVGTITGNTLTITRGQLGTTASAIDPGDSFTALTPDAVTTTINEGATFLAADTTLTVTDSAGFLISDVIRVDDELMVITGLTGNDLTVSRGVYGTTDVDHNDASTVTRYAQSASGFLQMFADGEVLDNGSGVTVEVGTVTSYFQMDRFLFNRSGTFEYPQGFAQDVDRVVRFTQEDASNAGHPLRFSLTEDGIWNVTPGVEYTTGVVKNGTPGTAGAYTEIDLSYDNIVLVPNNTLYIYCENMAEMGQTFPIVMNPFYDKLYVYDVAGEFTLSSGVGDAVNTYTVLEVIPGPYGYLLDDKDGTDIKVALGTGSIEITDTVTTTITGTTGSFDITVGSNTGIVVGMHVSGTGIGYNARVSEIVGTTITLNVENSDTVSGNGDFYWQFQDSPTIAASSRSLARVVSNTDINTEDYIAYDTSLAANATNRTASTVIGPGQSVMVYSSSGTVNFAINGFEDSTADFTPVLYQRERTV